MILDQEFFNRPTIRVARELLGKYLVRRADRGSICAAITDVEAYVGLRDKASHASRGRTPRNQVMFGPAGFWYVYLVYGLHHCLNIVTERDGYPAAILVRGITGASGPGRVCRYFGIDRGLNAKAASRASGLWIEDRGVVVSPRRIRRGPRIGVDYAGEWKDKKWRFYVEQKTP